MKMSFLPVTENNVPGLVLRAAVPQDSETLYAMIEELWQDGLKSLSLSSAEAVFDAVFGSNAKLHVPLAVVNGEVAGFAWLNCTVSNISSSQPETQTVLKRFRGKGIGAALVKLASKLQSNVEVTQPSQKEEMPEQLVGSLTAQVQALAPLAQIGALVMVGFGAIGTATLPLILRHVKVDRSKVVVIDPNDRNRKVAEAEGVRFIQQAVLTANMRSLLTPLLQCEGKSFLVNVSVDVSSFELIKLCRDIGSLYLDTCIEPELGGYTDPNKSMSQRTNYALREEALALRRENDSTAIVGHGANPGLVSHLVKRALQQLHLDQRGFAVKPTTQQEWAQLARDLGVKGIHIAERDTQRASIPKRLGEFVNTWSVDGFLSEGLQPAELGWGSHEKQLPHDGKRHEFGCDAAIYLTRPGANTRVRSWTPYSGGMQGFLITHNESISIADFFTLREEGQVLYRPTCHYAYHPCDDAVLSLHELQGQSFNEQESHRVMNEEIMDGMDELGVLLYGHARNAYWYGSQLTIQEARALAPHNTATTLQVSSAIVAAMAWAVANPSKGIVEADNLDHDFVLDIMMPYLGKVVGVYTDWTPLSQRRKSLFPEDLDLEDPWQFRNVIVR